MGELNDKQRLFAAEYIVDLNATQAAIRAGYSAKTAKQQGARLLTNADVWAAVAEAMDARAERLELTQDDVVRALRAIAFADIREVTEWGQEPDPYDENRMRGFLRLKPSTEITDEVALALTSVHIDVQNRLTVKLSDKLKALELLGRHLGMFKKDVDVHVHGGLSLLAELFGGEDDGDAGA